MNHPSRLRVRTDEIRAFLLDAGTPVTPETLRAAGLAAWAYVALPARDARRDAVRADYLRALRRHHEMRTDLAGLLRAWHEAGVEALLFKGFHLAEFVYPSPGMRFHGDIDVLVRPEAASAALAAAVACGWAPDFVRPRTSHDVCGLHGPGGTKVDLHRYAVHRRTRRAGAQPRITRALWAGATAVAWEGVTVRLPAPADALLVGLVLQRMWGDGGYLKPHDAIDARLLGALVAPGELEARAGELGCVRTYEQFRERCDPDAGRFAIVPTAADRRALARVVRAERGWFGDGVPALRRLASAPGKLLHIVRVLPDVVVARRRVGTEADLRALFSGLTPRLGDTRSSLRRRYLTIRAVRWTVRRLRLNSEGDCLLRSAAIYTALRRQGWPVAFVSGVRRDGGRVAGHAWVELDGRVLPELGEAELHLYAETWRWPPASTDGGNGLAEPVLGKPDAAEQHGNGAGHTPPDDG